VLTHAHPKITDVCLCIFPVWAMELLTLISLFLRISCRLAVLAQTFEAFIQQHTSASKENTNEGWF